jgi:hypothetical protein
MEKRGDIYKYLLENKNSLIELAKKFSSYNNANIDSQRIISFLLQLESLEKIKLFISFIEKITYLDQAQITELLEIAYNKADVTKNSAKIFPLGSVQDSSALACYRLVKIIFENEKDILDTSSDLTSIGDELEKKEILEFVLVDDNITSGTQVRNFFEELFNEVDLKNREMVKKPLTESQIERLRTIKIKLLFAVKLSDKSDQVIDELKLKYKVNLEVFYGKKDYTDYLAEMITVGVDKNQIVQWTSEISRGLFADKVYSEEKLNERLLGYGNLAKLTVFSHNTPKSLITPLWRTGTYRNLHWIPLFPEINEFKIIKQKSFDFHPLNKELSYLIINGKPIDPLPKLFPSVFPQNITLPSRIAIKKLMETFRKTINPEVNTILTKSSNPLQDALNNFYVEKYDSTLYKRYTDEVEKTNTALESYYDSIEDYILIMCSKKSLEFSINNTGDKDARLISWKTTFHTSKYILTSKAEIVIPKPIFSKAIPHIADFKGEVRVTKLRPDWNKLSVNQYFNISDEFDLNSECKDYIFDETDVLLVGDEKTNSFDCYITDATLESIKIPYTLFYIDRANDDFGSVDVNINRSEDISDETKKNIAKILKDFEIIGLHTGFTSKLHGI